MLDRFLKIDEHEYHQDLGRFSCSFLDRVERDPRDARDMLLGKPEPPPTDEMRLGKYVHYLALEGPEVAARRVALPPSQHDAYRSLSESEEARLREYESLSDEDRAVVDEWHRRPKSRQYKGSSTPAEWRLIQRVGKRRIVREQQDPSPEGAYRTMERKGAENERLWADFVESARGRPMMRLEQIPVATAMVRALRQHEKASQLLRDLTPELSMHWSCPHTGEPMKGRLDGAIGSHEIVELKCTAHVDPTNIVTWIRMGWARKAAVYLDAYKALYGRPARMWWVFVESTASDPLVHTCWVTEDHIFARVGRDGVPGRWRGYIDLIRWAQRCRYHDDWRHPWQLVQDGSMIVPDWLATTVENNEKLPELRGTREAANA